MPNWCSNSVEFKGKRIDVINMIENLKVVPGVYKGQKTGEETAKCVYSFESILPIPQEVLDSGYSMTGYDWQVDNWGVKWDVLDDAKDSLDEILKHNKLAIEEDGNPSEYTENGFCLDTPWGPCIKWYLALSEKYPQIDFKVSYEEDGMDYYGYIEVTNGEITEEKTFESVEEARYCLGESIEDVLSCSADWRLDSMEDDDYTKDEMLEEMMCIFKFYEDKEKIKNLILTEINGLIA